MNKTLTILTMAAGAAALCAVRASAAPTNIEYEIGGPLAGEELPLYPTQHGEAPGHPGCIPELLAKGEKSSDMGNEYVTWGPQGLAPEWDLYPGSVEHWRAYMFKYMPIRSFFDRQSQVHNWVAPAIPGAGTGRVEQYAEPVYWVPRHEAVRDTGYHNKPVPVVRATPGKTRFELDLGELDPGLYAVRVIGAVETAKLRPMRRPLILGMMVNDGVDGGSSTSRYRCAYVDEFYSVAELYFHAPVKRAYHASLWVDPSSQVDLLVHNISLDDTLAGTTRRALKMRATLGKSWEPTAPGKLKPDERLARDAEIWNAFPPMNQQAGGFEFTQAASTITLPTDVTRGDAEKPLADINKEYGPWTSGKGNVWIENKRLGLVYTIDDLRAHKPLPDPYPYKDNGVGIVYPLGNGEKGRVMYPIADEAYLRIRDWTGRWSERNLHTDEDSLRDAAIAMVRWAYDFPSIDAARDLCVAVREPGAYGRDWATRRRNTEAMYYSHYANYVDVLGGYDRLFDYLTNHPEIAESVHRFVPWVKTPRDLTELIDVYWVQTTAKRILRYHYHTMPPAIADVATIIGDSSFTDPWMEWLFSRTFTYPLPPSGIQDTMITGDGRDGEQYIGSTFYAQGEGAETVTHTLETYLNAGGNPRWDLSDYARYPKPVAQTWWRIQNVVAGGDFLRVGDVCGPDKSFGATLADLSFARDGWKWTHDPAFAWIIKNRLKRASETDEQWSAIEKAAATVPRAPWLDNRSRVLSTWATILESGAGREDLRQHQSAYLRIGFGMGHQHDDTFDLQFDALGLPMTIDGGQRPGYSTPGDRNTIVHNTVKVDDGDSYGHSWATVLADADGARYTAADSDEATSASLFRRAIALIDVDDHDAPRPRSYLFDVFRVRGGTNHTYGFHGPLSDDFQWNARNTAAPKEGSDDAKYLGPFKLETESHVAGDAPDTFLATWRYSVDKKGIGNGEKGIDPAVFDPNGPRKFTRLHLLGVGGARALQANAVCHKWGYDYTQVMVQRRGSAPLQSAFVGIYEPYAGEPFIQLTELLKIPGTDDGATRAVAAKIVPAPGRTDICFQDGAPGQPRKIDGEKLTVSGEFAFLSTDTNGLRQATLVGGTTLQAPPVTITAAAPQRTGKVVQVDYLTKTLWIDQTWPACATPSVFEIGVPGHMTCYTAASIEPAMGGTKIHLVRGADFLRSVVTDIDPTNRNVTVALKPILVSSRGNRQHWVASDDDGKTFWRADYLGESSFHLDGRPVSDQAFGKAHVLRLWEYGVGDTVRQSTLVSLRRAAAGGYEVQGDVDAEVTIAGQTHKITAAEFAKGGGRVLLSVR